MELYQLRTFLVIASQGNLTRAAKQLHASQPAVSAHIKGLEGELGVQLFQRTPKGMVLTEAGSRLQEHAKRVLETVEDMVNEATILRGVVQGDLRIGINTDPSTLRVTELFSRMRTQHPQLRIHLLQAMSGEVMEKMENDELDAGFIFGSPKQERLFSEQLQQLKLVVAGATTLTDQLTTQDAVQLGDYPWVTTPVDCPFHDISDSFFEKHGIKPDQVAVVDDENIIKSMVKNGAGLALLLQNDIHKSDNLTVWDREGLSMDLGIVCLRRRKDEPMLQSLFATLQQIWCQKSTPDNSCIPPDQSSS